jgi:hypothetical protein
MFMYILLSTEAWFDYIRRRSARLNREMQLMASKVTMEDQPGQISSLDK